MTTVSGWGNVDSSIQSIGTTYDDVGRVEFITSYSDATGTNIDNQIEYWYDGWGNVEREFQEHNGEVDDEFSYSGYWTKNIAYDYDDGSSPYVDAYYDEDDDFYVAQCMRLCYVTYPKLDPTALASPTQVQYKFTPGSIDDLMSRPTEIENNAASASYKYLGADRIVTEDFTDLEIKLDYSTGNFSAWDRFGQVVDQLWADYETNWDGEYFEPDNTYPDYFTYTYDRAGNITSRDNEQNSDLDEDYTYDDLYRLIATDRSLGTSSDQSWDLDGQGNFSTFTDGGTSQTRTVDEANQIETIDVWINPTYDAAGNMISGPKTGDETTRVHYVYDAWNRLTAVKADASGSPGDTITEYRYDGLGRRIKKTDGDTDCGNHYYYNLDWQILEDREVDQLDVRQSVNQYIWSPCYIDSPLVCLRDGDADGNVTDAYTGGYTSDWRRYYLTDAQHNVTTTIRVDNGNNIVTTGDTGVARNVYSAYGTVTRLGEDWSGGSAEENFDGPMYCGYWYDTDTSLYQVRNRYYDAGLSTFLNRDPIGYNSGDVNLYRYVGNYPTGAVDPQGTVIVLIHGVNTEAGWFADATTGLADFRKAAKCACPEEVIEFHWGDPGTWGGLSRKQGGHPNYATDNVADIYSTGWLSKERQYMGQTARRLKILLDGLNRIKNSTGAKESISVIAHSQGTILTLAALQKGAQVDNLIMMGSPLDVWPYDKASNDLLKAKSGIRGNTFNYWSSGDEWAWQKGGIGAYGSALAKISDLSWITNRQFGPGYIINGYTLPSTGEFKEYDHSDYMARAEFFAKIHGVDLGCPADNKISSDSGLEVLKNIAKNW